MDAVFGSTKCKRKLQFPSPSDGCDDPVKKVKKRKLLKTDDLEIVSFYSYNTLIECVLIVIYHTE